MLKEFVGTIADVKVGDLVMGTDNTWKIVKDVLPPFMPKLMYRLVTSAGYVECTGDHQWTAFDASNDEITPLGNFTTSELAVVMETFTDLRLGKPNGPSLTSLTRIEPKMSCCLVVDSPDHQFEIIPFDLDE